MIEPVRNRLSDIDRSGSTASVTGVCDDLSLGSCGRFQIYSDLAVVDAFGVSSSSARRCAAHVF